MHSTSSRPQRDGRESNVPRARAFDGFLAASSKANTFLKEHFVHVITLVVIAGALMPHASNHTKDFVLFRLPGGTWAFDLPTLSLYLMMLSASINCDPRDFVRLARAPRAISLAVGLFYFVLPALGALVAIGSRRAMGGDTGTEFAAGILLVGLMPVAMTSNIWVRMARGELPLAISMTTLTTALSVPVTPVYLTLLLDLSSNDVRFPTGTLVRLLVLCIVVPLLMGMALRQLARAWTARWQPLFALGGAVGLQIAVFANVGTAMPHLRDVSFVVLGAMVVIVVFLNLVNYGVAYFAGRAADLDYSEHAALGFAGGMRSNGTALVVGLKTFPAYPLVTVPAAIYIISQHLFAGVYLKILRRLVPYADKIVDRDTLFAELRRLHARFQRPRRLTLSLVHLQGDGAEENARGLAKEIRSHTNAADLVAVDGTVILVAFVARHTDTPELLGRLESIWKGPPLEMRIVHESQTLGQRAADDLYERCAAELDARTAE